MTAAVEVEKKHETCLVTVVQAGISDSVIKVFPATGKAEKVWLTNRPGVERWEEIQRFLEMYARRGTRVPKPVRYCSDSKKLDKAEISDADIPVVHLEEGVVFEPRQEEQHAPVNIPKPIQEAAEKARLEKLEAVVASQGAQLSEIAGLLKQALGQAAPVPAILKPEGADAEVACPDCGKTFKNEVGLRFHKGKYHKEGK